MRFSSNGVGIEYTVDGQRTGIPIVLIHGFPFSKEMWKPQVDALKSNHYVIAYDVRGHGGSDADSCQYTVEYFVDDLFGLIDHLKLPKVVVVGLSMGGYIALRAIERGPDRFKGLVLCDTRSESDTNEIKIRRAEQARTIRQQGMKTFADEFVKVIFSARSLEKNPEAVNFIKGLIEAMNPSAAAGTLIALAARTDCTAMLYNIKVPTLLLVGKNDAVTPPTAASAMKEKIPNATLHVIPNAAHVSNVENPAEFNNHLLDFLGKFKA